MRQKLLLGLAALLTGVMVFLWVWIVHVPRIFVSKSDNIAVFEALAVAGVAFVLAGWQEAGAASDVHKMRPKSRARVSG